MRRMAVARPARDEVVERDNMVRELVSGAPGMAVWAIGCATGVGSLHGTIRLGAGLMVIRRFAGSVRSSALDRDLREGSGTHLPYAVRPAPSIAGRSARAMIHESSPSLG